MTRPYLIAVIDSHGKTGHRTIDLGEPWSGWVPTDTVVANKEQPREFFDTEELAKLGESLRTGQANASVVIPFSDRSNPSAKWKLGDGERRLRALKAEGLNKVWVTYSPDITEENLHAVSFKANCCRQGHTHVEMARAIDRELRTGKKYAEIGAMVGRAYQWALDEHRLLQLEPSLLKLIDPPTQGKYRIPLAVAKELSKLPHDQQLTEWQRLVKSGASKGRMRLILQASSELPGRGRGRGATKRVPSDDIDIIKNRLRKITGDLHLFNTEWEARIMKTMAGVNVSLMVEALDEIQSEGAKLRNLLVRASESEKTEGATHLVGKV